MGFKFGMGNSGRGRRPGWEAGLRLLGVVVIFVLLNHLSFRHHRSVDFSRNQKFTLDPASRQFLAQLGDQVNIISLFSAGSEISGDVRSLLDQIRAEGGGNVRLEHLDPARQPDRCVEVKARYDVKLRSNAVIVSHRDRKQVIPEEEMVVRDDAGRIKQFAGEIALLSAMIEVLEAEPKKVYVVTGYQRADYLQEVHAELTALGAGQNMLVEFLNLGAGQEVPEDADALVLAAPQVDPPENDLARLKEYWGSRGGALFLTLDPDASTPALEAFLRRLGVVARDDRLVYRRSSLAGGGRNIFTVPARVRGGTPVGRELEGLTMTLDGRSQSLRLFADADIIKADNIHLKPLLVADARYWGETDFEEPEVRRDRTKDHHAPLYLGAMVERGAVDDPNLRVQTQRLVVVSNPSLLSDGETRQKLEADFVLASLNWLMDRPELIGISLQEPTRYALVMDPRNRQVIERFTGVVLPALVGAIGVLVWYVRRK